MSNGVDQLALVVVGHPQGVAGDQVDLAADLLDLGVGVDVVAEAGDVGLDPDVGRDLVHLGLVPVVAPGQPVERAGRPGRAPPPTVRRSERRAGGGALAAAWRRRGGGGRPAGGQECRPVRRCARGAPASLRNSRRPSCWFRSSIPCSSRLVWLLPDQCGVFGSPPYANLLTQLLAAHVGRSNLWCRGASDHDHVAGRRGRP